MRERLSGFPSADPSATAVAAARFLAANAPASAPDRQLNLRVAQSHRARRLGLAGQHVTAEPGLALLLPSTRSVHTFGMAFRLDLIWLDPDGDVVRVDLGVPPCRVRTCLAARSVIELPSGRGH